jgi:hypothetical protein
MKSSAHAPSMFETLPILYAATLYGVDMPTSFSTGASTQRQVLKTSGTTVN